MLSLLFVLVSADVLIRVQPKAITVDAQPFTLADPVTEEMCKRIGGPVGFADKNKPVPVLEAAPATPWKDVRLILQWVKACDFEHVRVGGERLSVKGSNADTGVVVLSDKKAKLVDGGTFVDFSPKDLATLQIVADPGSDLFVAPSDAASFSAVSAMVKTLAAYNVVAYTGDPGAHPAIAQVLGAKIADGVTERPLSEAILSAVGQAEHVWLASAKRPAWTQIDRALVCKDGQKAIVLGVGVGVAKRSPKAQIAADRVADNAARTALYSLPGTRDPKAEAQIVDRYFEGEDVYALAYLPAPDALAPGANEACPGEPTKRVWSVRPVRGGEQPAPVVAAAKDGVSLQGWSLVLRTPIPSEAQAKLGGYAIAPLRLAALLAEGAFASPKLTDAQRTCLTALPWAQITEKAQSSFDAAALVTVLNIEKIRRAAVTNKCDVRAVTAVLKELRVPKCAPPR